MSHPRVEEVTDSSGSDSDPDVVDISTIAAPASSGPRNPSLMNPANIPVQAQRPAAPQFDASKTKSWVTLYPVYFDASRTKQQGRRVGKDMAVENPLARTMADAAARLDLKVYLEAQKRHPRDWSNPGRIKVELKGEDGKLKNPNIKNKWALYVGVSKYLKASPTTKETPMQFVLRGLPTPEEPPDAPAIPRGWKMGTVLPLHSAAVSDGGVSENMLKEMMQGMPGMQGLQGGGGSGTSTPGGSSKKKDKKKGK